MNSVVDEQGTSGLAGQRGMAREGTEEAKERTGKRVERGRETGGKEEWAAAGEGAEAGVGWGARMTREMVAFIEEHEGEDPGRLVLAGGRWPGVDVAFAAGQIEARRVAREKLPGWWARREVVYPGRVAVEQCSSEATARYKAGLARGERLWDVTGGLGVDTFYMGRGREAVHVERQRELHEAARHNFGVLGAGWIRCAEGDGREWARRARGGTLYADPSRRAAGGRRVVALGDCEPDVVALWREARGRVERLVAKVSPMEDVTALAAALPGTREVHVVGWRGECREVVAVADGEMGTGGARRETSGGPLVVAVELVRGPEGVPEGRVAFTAREEREAGCRVAGEMGAYLYEPWAAVLKAGAFRTVGARWGVEKLETSSHLYTSGELVANFPGRAFRVEEVVAWGGRAAREVGRRLGRANVTTRNFPMSVAEVRARTGLREGGEVYVFATTARGAGRCLVVCRKA